MSKYIFTILFLIGYTLNIWGLTSKEIKGNFISVNYIGVVLFPIGGIMGYVYIANKYKLIKL